MELQVSIIDGKLIPERHQSAMAITDSEKRIFGILGSAPDLTEEVSVNGYELIVIRIRWQPHFLFL
jgi:hypothetical protein